MTLDPSRTVAELKELRELTGNEDGAQRVAWTDTWVHAQEWMAAKLEGTGAKMEFDEARNQWWTLRGRSDKELLIGGQQGCNRPPDLTEADLDHAAEVIIKCAPEPAS